jgi:hypothetical protein
MLGFYPNWVEVYDSAYSVLLDRMVDECEFEEEDGIREKLFKLSIDDLFSKEEQKLIILEFFSEIFEDIKDLTEFEKNYKDYNKLEKYLKTYFESNKFKLIEDALKIAKKENLMKGV